MTPGEAVEANLEYSWIGHDDPEAVDHEKGRGLRGQVHVDGEGSGAIIIVIISDVDVSRCCQGSSED